MIIVTTSAVILTILHTPLYYILYYIYFKVAKELDFKFSINVVKHSLKYHYKKEMTIMGHDRGVS